MQTQSQNHSWVESAKRSPICSIGQISPAELRQLDKAVKSGELVKRRAPFAGNLGALKTYYAASDAAFDSYQAEQVIRFDICVAMDAFNRKAA